MECIQKDKVDNLASSYIDTIQVLSEYYSKLFEEFVDRSDPSNKHQYYRTIGDKHYPKYGNDSWLNYLREFEESKFDDICRVLIIIETSWISNHNDRRETIIAIAVAIDEVQKVTAAKLILQVCLFVLCDTSLLLFVFGY